MKKLLIILTILLLTPNIGYGATRFYLPSSGTPAVSPAYSAWTNTAIAERAEFFTTPQSTTMTTQTSTETPGNGQTILFKQYVSEPLAAQTISGTLTGQLRVLTSGTANINFAATVKIYSGDGTTLKDTVLALSNVGGYSIASTLTNRSFGRNTLASSFTINLATTTVDEGDIMVVELGMGRFSPWGAGTQPHSISFGDDSGTDLPVDNTTTAADNPWIQFSGDIAFAGGGPSTPDAPQDIIYFE